MASEKQGNGKGGRTAATVLLSVGTPFALAAAGLVGLFVFNPSAGQRLKDQVANEIEVYRCRFDLSCVGKEKEEELQVRAKAKATEFMKGLDSPGLRSDQLATSRQGSRESELSSAASAALYSVLELSSEGESISRESARYLQNGDISRGCRGIRLAANKATEIFATLTPHAREIQIKQPENMNRMLAGASTLERNLSVAVNNCERAGF